MGQFCSPSRQTTKEKAKKKKKERKKERGGGHMGRPTGPATCTTAQPKVACPPRSDARSLKGDSACSLINSSINQGGVWSLTRAWAAARLAQAAWARRPRQADAQCHKSVVRYCSFDGDRWAPPGVTWRRQLMLLVDVGA
jgi:hypothetical protein